MSIRGGLWKALDRAEEMGASSLQIFSGSPRTWKNSFRSDKEISKFVEKRKLLQIPVFIHAKYLINLGSSEKRIADNSFNSLRHDLILAEKIGAEGVVFHPRGKINPLVKNIKKLLNESSSTLIVENTAQSRLSFVHSILKKVSSSRLKFCLDTAHAFEAGYSLNTPKGRKALFSDIKKAGVEKLSVVHVNDSKTKAGSKNDKHENIGKGKIGKESFFLFLNHPFTSCLPFILETPGFDQKGPDEKNINILKDFKGRNLSRDFYNRETPKVARDLVGKFLTVRDKGIFKAGVISETEAYLGPEDGASHARFGKTKRSKIMWEKPGLIYIYLVYGMHHCFNIVAHPKGKAGAVLVRSVKPVFGVESKTDGPGKLCSEFGVDMKDRGVDIVKAKKFNIKDVGLKLRPTKKKRVGVDYAGEWGDKKMRFVRK